MYLIVGLGNPGQKYEFTRHNVGFLAIDRLLDRYGNPKEKSEHKALTYKISVDGHDVLLAKPQTFMNLSGESVQPLLAFYKIPLENLLVLHDDKDQNFLSVKFQQNSSSGGQNGINSIHQMLGTPNYTRLKLGIGAPTLPNQSTADYVLQKFSLLEASLLANWLDYVGDAVESLVVKGYEKSASGFNLKMPPLKDLIEKQLVNEKDLDKNDFFKVLETIKKK
jgi:PTH1 family peptidyl-tRNA hydrolase